MSITRFVPSLIRLATLRAMAVGDDEADLGRYAWFGEGFGSGGTHPVDHPGYTDYRLTNPRFTPEALAANMPLVNHLRDSTSHKKASPAQVAFAWLLAQKPWIVPIPGTTNLRHLEENLGAVHVEFSPEELREFNAAVSKIEIHGARLRKGLLELSDVEAPIKG